MDFLNAQQKQAVEAAYGPLAIIAGPGTGKTKTLTARISYLIAHGVQPSSILALTFTKKAAAEMAARVGQKGATICTFHALCHQLLGDNLVFITEPERLAVIKSLPKLASLKGAGTRDLSLLISRYKNKADTSPAAQQLTVAYNVVLQQKGMIDFDDLLVFACDKLAKDPAAKPHYEHILVDEFQDTNTLQYELLHLLKSNDNLFVIGDPNQSIYAFRGASGSIFTQFGRDFPEHASVNLTINYRSAPQIVTLSNHIFPAAPQLEAHNQRPGVAQAVRVLNEYSEAHWVIDKIQQAIGGADLLQATHGDVRYGLRDFAILYRNRSIATVMQKYIADSGLPYQVAGEGSPYERPEVQRLLTMLRTAQDHGLANGAPAEVASKLAAQAGLDSKEIHQIISTFVRFTTVSQALEHVDNIADQQFYDPDAEAITLLTIHASKGLEFTRVFLLGAEEGLLPHKDADQQEERRLFYVAATRAKEHLDILHTTRRKGQNANPSRFVKELPHAVMPLLDDPDLHTDRIRSLKRHAKTSQTSLF